MEVLSEPDRAMTVNKSRIASFEKDGNQVLHGQFKNLMYTGFLLRCQKPLLVGYPVYALSSIASILLVVPSSLVGCTCLALPDVSSETRSG